ncbi:MAG: GNAT family N-acetyltransferase [Robiginitalea sp.]|nr:GNAT family N-acetyltransferase [Robiginitalea sp.]
MAGRFLFTSPRLGFRNWEEADLDVLARLNADPEVMRYFPAPLTREESRSMLVQLQEHFASRGYTYYATELLSTGEFVGLIGLKYQEYTATFTPATDIGWRLRKEFWGQGYASEGAKRCLDHAFEDLGLNRVVSVCPALNTASERVMRKIGMQRQGEFEHPGLQGSARLNPCVWYEVKNTYLP